MGIAVKSLLEAEALKGFLLRLVAGEKGLDREIETSRIQKPGLLLTGTLNDQLHSDRIQIFGVAEIGYLASLPREELRNALSALDEPKVPALVVTKGQEPPDFLVGLCSRRDIPLITTTHSSSLLIEGISKYLEDALAPTTTVHGVLLDVLGIGVLITGKSGIGKSECALDMITRGYRLVSDDAVLVKRLPPGVLCGTATDLIRYHIEIRGLGIVNIKDLYGITAIREKKQMDIVVELERWDPESEYERLGLDDNSRSILGVELPCMRIPVSPGRSVATIVEVAARNQILKIMGHYSARNLEAALIENMRGDKELVRPG